MKLVSDAVIKNNKIFAVLGLVTGLVLLLPYLAMRYSWQVPDPGSGTDGVNWSLGDFVVMGTLIFGMGSLCILAARRVAEKNRLAVGILFGILFLWLWAELAVGVFTNIGS